MSEASGSTVTLEAHPDVHARMELWALGRAHLFRSESSGMAMRLGERQARRETVVPTIALAVQERSSGYKEQFGDRQVVPAGRLMMMDLTAPFEFSWSTRGASRALQVPIAELGLPIDLVRLAASRLHTSPLHEMMTTHVVDLFRSAEGVSGDPFGMAVGSASIDLVRALLASAARASHVPAADHQALLTRIREYVRQHIRDPDLARPDAAQRSISLIAHRWGFRTPPTSRVASDRPTDPVPATGARSPTRSVEDDRCAE